MIDLHMHSVFSDGSLPPDALVAIGRDVGLKAMALTDHDTTRGVPEFLRAAAAVPGMKGFSGVEISAEISRGTMHILGYGVNPGYGPLEQTLEHLRDGREWRNEQILEKLNTLGLVLNWEEVAAYAGDDVVGRPHFAQAMIQRGYARDKQDAFDRYLAKGRVAYVDRFRLEPEAAVRLIREAGGVPVLAHPFTLQLDRASLRAKLLELRDVGLGGIEVYYSEHGFEQVRLYASLARELGLLMTGGSDFHGEANPEIRLGTGFGSLRVPNVLARRLEEALAGQANAGGGSKR